MDSIEADLGVRIAWKALVLRPNQDSYTPTRKLYAEAANEGGHMLVDGETFVPVDCHWHFPSEHTLGAEGRVFDAEVHIVHVHQDDVPYALQGKLDWCRIAVIGVFIKEGRSTYAAMKVAAGEDAVTVSIGDLIPLKSKATRYNGSLTTPPYSENVTFIIFDKPMTATAKQLNDGGLPNARPCQAQNRRFCLHGAPRLGKGKR